MKKEFQIVSFTLLTLLTSSVFAQDTLPTHNSVRLELGLGPGSVGDSFGLGGRVAFSVIKSNWGGIIRLTAHDGEKGVNNGWFGPPIEKFYDKAILVSYVLKNRKSAQVIASAGIGSFYGEQLNETKENLVRLNPTTGFAYELSIASARSTIGCTFSIVGNINSRSNIIAIMLSITLGYQK